jgi:hypothetical protein
LPSNPATRLFIGVKRKNLFKIFASNAASNASKVLCNDNYKPKKTPRKEGFCQQSPLE